MKTLTLICSFLAVASAIPNPEVAEALIQDTAVIPLDNPLIRSTVQGEKILPRLSQSTPKDGATRKVVKYGSYMVSSTKMMSTIKLVEGPCMGTCYVTAMEATIRYPDGKEANIDSGAWLHHIALFGSGAGQGSLWAAGNERPTLRLNGAEKFGLDFPAAFMLMIDLMTEDVKAKNLTLEINYETVPKTGGYKGVNMYWLTIGEPAAKKGQYKFNTLPSVSTVTGSLLYAIGHMHDGGTDMRLFVGGQLVCKSIMHYNARPGYIPPGSSSSAKAEHHKRQSHGGHGGGAGGLHISDPGACTDFGTIKTGDRLTAEAWYDADKYGLMIHNGKTESLMGNMRVYVGGGGTGSKGSTGSSTPAKGSTGGGAGGGLLAGLFGGAKTS